MRALRVHEFGGLDRLSLEDEVEVPDPGFGEVRVRVEAAGINFADTLMIGGRYQVRPPLPFSPGFEVAGTIDAVGEGVDAYAVADLVIANPWYGGFADYVVLPEVGVLSRPESVSSTTAAGATATFGTAHHALTDRGRLRSGELVLVSGATGGVGSASVQVAKALGATVIGAVGSESKAGIARTLGCDHVVVYGTDASLRDQIAEAAGGRGRVDVVLDIVGGPGFGEALRELGPGGRALVVGFAGGEIPQIPANILLVKEIDVVGVFWGAFRERDHGEAQRQLDTIWAWFDDGSLTLPPISTHSLDEVPLVLERITQREIVGKAVVDMAREAT